MSAETEPNPQPTPSNPEPVDWATPDPDEVRLPQPKPEPEEQPDPDNAVIEGDDEPPDPTKTASETDDDPIGDDPNPEDGDEPPEFWSAEKKALWAKVQDPEVRAAIKDHVQQITTGTARKLEENAAKVRQAEEGARQAHANQEQAVAFWQQTAPVLAAIIDGEFAGVNLDELSKTDPAKWAEVKQGMEARQNWLQRVNAHIAGQAKQVEDRRQSEHQTARVMEHAKLAQKFPKEFGSPEASKRSYDALGTFLVSKGIAPDRVNAIYEAPIVEIVRMAYKYEKLQAKAKGITTPKPSAQSASTTPTRIVPGARSSANPVNEAVRQAEERLRSGKRLTPEEAALAFR